MASARRGVRFMEGLAAERADVVAYLARRRANAVTMAENFRGDSEGLDLAKDRARQLDIVLQEISTGLHEGEAEVALRQAQDGRGFAR